MTQGVVERRKRTSGKTPRQQTSAKNPKLPRTTSPSQGRRSSAQTDKQPQSKNTNTHSSAKHKPKQKQGKSALVERAADFLTSLEETPPKVVFLSDCLSALQVLTAPAEHLVEELKKSLNDLSQKASVVLQWIPAHCGIAGNEKADGLAKDAGRQEQPETSLSFRETKTLIKHRWKTAFKERNGGYKPDQDPIHRLSRAEQTAIFRLRTGHCGFKAHLKRIGVAESALCDCGAADQTVEHVLNTCTNFTLLRNQIWPEGATLETKLWGTSEDLKATFQYTTTAELRP
ncbi:uncharacterized protein [Littorina saxatilis]|uniref:uncharacterized protein n=1 Tax=Littorina saxatilis TaxID=31220 RepID=UPI0038B6852D